MVLAYSGRPLNTGLILFCCISAAVGHDRTPDKSPLHLQHQIYSEIFAEPYQGAQGLPGNTPRSNIDGSVYASIPTKIFHKISDLEPTDESLRLGESLDDETDTKYKVWHQKNQDSRVTMQLKTDFERLRHDEEETKGNKNDVLINYLNPELTSEQKSPALESEAEKRDGEYRKDFGKRPMEFRNDFGKRYRVSRIPLKPRKRPMEYRIDFGKRATEFRNSFGKKI